MTGVMTNYLSQKNMHIFKYHITPKHIVNLLHYLNLTISS